MGEEKEVKIKKAEKYPIYSCTLDGLHFYVDLGDGAMQIITRQEYLSGKGTEDVMIKLDGFERRIKKLEASKG